MREITNGEIVAEIVDGLSSGWNVLSFEHACTLAALATETRGGRYLPVDKGRWTSPRYTICAAPVIGAEVSRYFNGDGYPAGRIVSVSASFRVVRTEDGTTFYRRGQSATWIATGGTWAMVQGRNTDRNPCF